MNAIQGVQSATLDRLLAASTDIIMITGLDGAIQLISPACNAILGYAPFELHCRRVPDLVHPDDLAKTIRHVRACRRGEQVLGARARWRRKGGQFVWLESNATPVLSEGTVYCVLREITGIMQVKEQLEWEAYHDSLTGLRNRIWFMNSLKERFAQSRGEDPSLLFLDVDNFKRVNDSLGHLAGDDLLVQLATRLEEAIGHKGTPIRLGGDEFAILLHPCATRQEAITAAERVEQALGAPFVVCRQEIFVTFSIGIARRRAEHLEPADLLRDADVAHYWAKNHGKARYALFEPQMNQRALERLKLETDLRGAIDRQEFCVYYQPIVDLQTGQLDGMEALLRWHHPQLGLVAPGEFIALAEETGMIVEIGHWVLAEACRQVKLWQERHPEPPAPFVSVNLSPRQLHQPDLVKQVAGVLQRYELSPDSLQLEITEGVLMLDEEPVLECLKALRALGVRLALDDFGTGFSSLSYLGRFPVETLKIALPFVQGLGQDQEATAIVRAIVMLAKTLNMAVTAEGVESHEQMAMLQALGCDRVQGYYLGRPLPVEQAEELLGQHLVYR